MRILTVSHFFEGHGGGIERVAGQLCRQFARLGVQAVWAASDCDPSPEGKLDAVPLSCVNPTEKLTGLPMPIPGVSATRALGREVRCSDAVIVHDALYVTSILGLLMAKAYGKRVILIQHIAAIPFSSPVLRFLMALANRFVTRPMLWAADERVFISDTVRHELIGSPARFPYKLIFNGVDREIFHPPAPQDSCLGGEAIPSEGRKILFVGRYVQKKGLTVLHALAMVRPDLTFLLAGSGPIRPTEWGLGNVRDLGVQSAQALAELYRSVDLLLLPSVGEGYPLVIQEAMACGLPVICGEPTDRADPNAARWLCGVAIDLTDPAGSARRCSTTIDSHMPSRKERAAMARYAREKYDWESMAQSLISLAGGERSKVVT